MLLMGGGWVIYPHMEVWKFIFLFALWPVRLVAQHCWKRPYHKITVLFKCVYICWFLPKKSASLRKWNVLKNSLKLNVSFKVTYGGVAKLTLQMEQQILQMYDVAEKKSFNKKLHRWRNKKPSKLCWKWKWKYAYHVWFEGSSGSF